MQSSSQTNEVTYPPVVLNQDLIEALTRLSQQLPPRSNQPETVIQPSAPPTENKVPESTLLSGNDVKNWWTELDTKWKVVFGFAAGVFIGSTFLSHLKIQVSFEDCCRRRY